MLAEEGSLTPKPMAAASSSSTTPVIAETDPMQVSKSSFTTAPSPGDISSDLPASASPQSTLDAGPDYPPSAVDSG